MSQSKRKSEEKKNHYSGERTIQEQNSKRQMTFDIAFNLVKEAVADNKEDGF